MYTRDFHDAIETILAHSGNGNEWILRKLLDKYFSNGRWIPCKKMMPELEQDVFVCAVNKHDPDDKIMTITRYTRYIWFGHAIEVDPYWKDPWQYFHTSYEITHWRQLPNFPEEEM